MAVLPMPTGAGINYLADPTADYQWRDNGQGGINYYQNGTPVTRELFQAGVRNQGDTQTDVDALEDWVASRYSGGQQDQAGASATGGSSLTDSFRNQQLARLNERENMYKGDIERQYGDQVAGANMARGQGEQNINRSREKLSINRTNSLRDLAGNIRQQNQALQIRLGNAGAGDSSATKMGAYALQNLQNSNRNQILENVAQSEKDIQIQWDQLQQNFAQNMRNLDTWKQSQLNRIIDQFQQSRDQLSAAQQLAQIDNIYNQAANQVVEQHNMNTAALSGAGQNINSNPIDQANVNPNVGYNWVPSGTSSGYMTPGPRGRRDNMMA